MAESIKRGQFFHAKSLPSSLDRPYRVNLVEQLQERSVTKEWLRVLTKASSYAGISGEKSPWEMADLACKVETRWKEVNVYILGTLYRRFRSRASHLYYRRTYSNAIVYVDKANRFIPQNPDDDRKELARELIDGIRTTRQYGLAWWFADQRPASISKDAFTQMGTYFFGKGMNAVADRASMESVLGEDGCNIYDYVITTGGRPFVVTGQFVGIGSSDYVPVPIEFFSNWQELADNNNRDFATRIRPPATSPALART